LKGPVLVTGAAGFIGAAVSQALLDLGCEVVGVDNLNAYYSQALKRARLDRLQSRRGFSFREADIADHAAAASLPGAREAGVIVHLAAQAGVRHSLENPFAYAASNLVGHLSMLELARHSPSRPFLVYASSSSVYGTSAAAPFSESDPCAHPVSLYAATKRADELMSEAYAALYGVPQTGLRFFTVYGPWGRPDMAYWSFAENILAGRPIRVFNHGDLKRDFTYIDDIVAGVVSIATGARRPQGPAPHAIYNIGNNRPVQLLRFIEILEGALGRPAIKEMAPMQAGDVYETCADISAIGRDYGFAPKTPLEQGLAIFADWFKTYRKTAP
jgi:UDP-glucuronate 4-epimerase